MEWMDIAQVADELQVSKAAVYKRVKSLKIKLKPHLKQEAGKTLISQDGFKVLQQHVRPKEGTLWETINEPQKSASVDSTFNKHSTDKVKLNETFNDLFESLRTEVQQKNHTIDRLLNQLEEDRKRQAEERQRTDTIIMKLAHDLEVTRKSALAIEAKVDALASKPEDKKVEEILKKPAPEIKPWEPAPKKEPQLSGLKKLWYEFMNPVKLRAI